MNILFDQVVKSLTKANIPCTVCLSKWHGKESIDVVYGMDFPDSLMDKTYDALEADNVPTRDLDFCGDMSSSGIIKSTNIAGGKRNYPYRR